MRSNKKPSGKPQILSLASSQNKASMTGKCMKSTIKTLATTQKT